MNKKAEEEEEPFTYFFDAFEERETHLTEPLRQNSFSRKGINSMKVQSQCQKRKGYQ